MTIDRREGIRAAKEYLDRKNRAYRRPTVLDAALIALLLWALTVGLALDWGLSL